MNQTPIAKIVLFLLVTIAISAVPYYGIISSGTLGTNAPLLMLSPGVAALIVQWTFERNLRGLGWRLGRFRFLRLPFGGLQQFGGHAFDTAGLTVVSWSLIAPIIPQPSLFLQFSPPAVSLR